MFRIDKHNKSNIQKMGLNIWKFFVKMAKIRQNRPYSYWGGVDWPQHQILPIRIEGGWIDPYHFFESSKMHLNATFLVFIYSKQEIAL